MGWVLKFRHRVWLSSVVCDAIICVQENELWKLTKATGETDPETGKAIKRPLPECGAYVTGLLGVVALAAAMVEPYIPAASARIAEQLNVPLSSLRLSDAFIAKASVPHTIIPAGASNCSCGSLPTDSCGVPDVEAS